MNLTLARRAFLLAFIPLCVLLASSFYLVSTLVRFQVRAGLRNSLEEVQRKLDRTRSAHELRNSRLLAIVAENPSLKAGVDLWRNTPEHTADVRQTLDDQLAEIANVIDCDLLLVSTAEPNEPIAGVVRPKQDLQPVDLSRVPARHSGLTMYDGNLYSTTAIPVNLHDEHVATLTIGRAFELDYFTGQTALLRQGRVLQSNVSGVSSAVLEQKLAGCGNSSECEVTVGQETYLATRAESAESTGDFQIFHFQSVDSAIAPLQHVLRQVFVLTALLALAGAGALSYASARSLARPLVVLVERLRRSERAGRLPEDFKTNSAITEVDELARALNRAAKSIADSRGRLEQAYTSFIDSLAASIDARDVYTAGHSQRVSRYSSQIAVAMGLSGEFQERLRVGALLHDIGKIGIPDAILQKPSALTDEEFHIIQRHPSIGRRILEGIEGFETFLSIVELHHENHNGSGYPHGHRATDIPLDARIVHVADAYDAMTSDRPYRKGLSHEEAIARIVREAGQQFDPEIAECFARMAGEGWRGEAMPAAQNDLLTLSDQVTFGQHA